jgi:hypothetical protein
MDGEALFAGFAGAHGSSSSLGLYSLAIHVAKARLRATVLFAGANPAPRGRRLGAIRKSGRRI